MPILRLIEGQRKERKMIKRLGKFWAQCFAKAPHLVRTTVYKEYNTLAK